MAAATKVLARSGNFVAVLNFDNVTLLATGVTIANIGGIESIIFTITIAGTDFSRTVGIGQSAVITFPSPIQITQGTAPNGGPSFALTGHTSHGVSTS